MGTAKLCVTVTARTMAELRARRDRVTGADLVEIRLDSVPDPDAAGAVEGRRLPVIVTCRPTWEGGGFSGSEETRKRLLTDARAHGAEFVDVEWKAGFDDIVCDRDGHGVVLSHHAFEGTPRDLADRARAMRGTPAAVVKVAAMAHRLSDSLALRDIGLAAAGSSVVVAMGEAGLASRVLAGRFGSRWTYAGDEAAPGQVPAETLSGCRFGKITDATRLFGVVGRPVSHSLSPAIHNAAFAAAGVDAAYVPLAAADFDDFLTLGEALGFEGASVTAPYKRDAYRSVVQADGDATGAESVNTLRRSAAGWVGRNTDMAGFMEPLEVMLKIRGRRVTVLGAGGAARSVARALADQGARVSIAARSREHGAAAARVTGAAVGEWPPAGGSWDVLVNATPVGTAPALDETPLPNGLFTGDVVYDLVYNPSDTRLLRDARAAGCRTVSGLEMLVAQARRQFEWWTGRPAPVAVMREAAVRALAARTNGAARAGHEVTT
jgi:3-dehydroquinate dehydratase/shikimate dehydrogenase